MRVEQLPLAEIEENENNSYAQTGIDELAESIKVIGCLLYTSRCV